MNFSVIIPVYNRPEEVRELLESLCRQTRQNFEVIIVEDGSTETCKDVARKFDDKLDIQYHFTENTGPALSRNFGAGKALYDYYIFLDSDCIVPPDYFDLIEREILKDTSVDSISLDVFGGPDRSDAGFSKIQKAISYAMTSLLTTGGIRGGKKRLDKFYPRSFNMGVSREAFEAVDGFADMRFGEDLDLSLRLEKAGFKMGLIEEAFVYHKRRSTFKSFYKQVFNSGLARIHLAVRHPKSLKSVHFLPTLFVLYLITSLLSTFLFPWIWIPFAVLLILIFFDSLFREKEIAVALLSVVASLVQITGYGTGFLTAVFKKWILRDENFTAFEETFYE